MSTCTQLSSQSAAVLYLGLSLLSAATWSSSSVLQHSCSLRASIHDNQGRLIKHLDCSGLSLQSLDGIPGGVLVNSSNQLTFL